MIKKVSIILIILFFTLIPIVFGYSNELFKFDLPEGYGSVEYQNTYIFAKTDDSSRGLIVMAKEDSGLKKSVWNVDDSDLNKIVRSFSLGSNVIETEKKAKLGKEKAIRFLLESDGDYIEMYILASNKYIYAVMFAGKSQSDFDNDEYKMIKKSFKLKDRTTNPTVIYVLVAVAAIGIKPLIKFLKARKEYSYNNYGNVKSTNNNLENIDYKNMTEEDFKKFDE